jgi:hypothetical protein
MITDEEIIELIKRLKAEGKEWETLDAKQDLYLEGKGDKAEFAKDVLALANSGQTAYIITGLKDETWEPINITQHHTQDTLNQILKERCDPPLNVEYVEREIQGVMHGAVKIVAGDPPYIVCKNCDGPISKKHSQAQPEKEKNVFIHRGTVFVRRGDFNDGALRADLERIYAEKRRAKLVLIYDVVEIKAVDDLLHVGIEFSLRNQGIEGAGAPFFLVHFKDVAQIVECTRPLKNATKKYNGRPSITASWNDVIHTKIVRDCGRATIALRKSAEKIEAFACIKATNMNTKEGWFTIPLQGEHVQSI